MPLHFYVNFLICEKVTLCKRNILLLILRERERLTDNHLICAMQNEKIKTEHLTGTSHRDKNIYNIRQLKLCLLPFKLPALFGP